MQICQITGFKNSGKTTLMSQLIRYFSEEGLKVGSLKHHGHGGEPDMAEGTDSEKHFKSGSVISGVQGGGLTQLTLHRPFEIEELIQFYGRFKLDLLLVEGYKQADYPKIVLIKNKAELSLLQEVSNIIAVVTCDVHLENPGYPAFDMNDLHNDITALAGHIRRDSND
ncbi:molybdopterin-guanine dinucleotide biosynthesis protein B [Lentibacillus jeotgali]|uniref:molybdopterin-guanine dinucleotide biosynthesis protein B n=1 Tax=Lentibacillus jeotgali TaxID=558169 RepID=UPI00026273EA|nr:molybdopterin-guanine dinucleotide biosynthesis protein B [Lentibacillus jeotgali]